MLVAKIGGSNFCMFFAFDPVPSCLGQTQSELDKVGKGFLDLYPELFAFPSKLCMPDYLNVDVLYYGPCYKGRGEDGLGKMFLLNRVDMLMTEVFLQWCYLVLFGQFNFKV